jgi:hypothetical protein
MPTKIVVDCATGITEELEMTAEEVAAQQEMDAVATERRAAEEAAEAQRLADKESGNQKLKDLGLTDDEISAITS